MPVIEAKRRMSPGEREDPQGLSLGWSAMYEDLVPHLLFPRGTAITEDLAEKIVEAARKSFRRLDTTLQEQWVAFATLSPAVRPLSIPRELPRGSESG